jgi:hypothetical protein
MRFFFIFIQNLNIGFVTQEKVPFRQGRLINGIWGAAFPDRIAFLQQNLIWTIFLKIRPHVFDISTFLFLLLKVGCTWLIFIRNFMETNKIVYMWSYLAGILH